MTTPSAFRIASTTRHSGRSDRNGSQPQWRCTRCNKLLGIHRDGRMHIRFSAGHEYLTGFPVSATCRGCGTLNRVAS